MKTFALLMALSAGAALAGSGVVAQQSGATQVSYYSRVPHIPQPILQGIKDLAVQVHPTHPKDQVEAITDGVNAYLALKTIPDTPAKQAAARDYPFNFPKQLYLAQRPFQN